MAYPDYIPTRAVTLGGAMGLESSNLIKIVATVTASRPLIWQATGYRFESMAHTVQAEAGMEMSLALPCTDSPGWKDARTGALIDVSAADSYSHRYTVKLSFLDENGRALAIPQYTVGPFVLPAEDGSPVDLDKMVPTSSTAGDQVAVPDSWTASVSAAESLAAEAQAMLEAATADPDAGTLVRRREGGTVAVGTATAGDEAIPRAQLDALVAAQVADQDTELSAALSSTYVTVQARPATYRKGRGGTPIPVVMLHNMTSLADAQGRLKDYKSWGYETIFFSQLVNYLRTGDPTGLPEKPICITDDDGGLSAYQYLYPALVEFDMKATFFIVPKWINGDITTPPNGGTFLEASPFTWANAREMFASGRVEFQSHTLTHGSMRLLSGAGTFTGNGEGAGADYLAAKAMIEANVPGAVVTCSAAPYGVINETAITSIAAAGCTGQRITGTGTDATGVYDGSGTLAYAMPGVDPLRIPIADQGAGNYLRRANKYGVADPDGNRVQNGKALVTSRGFTVPAGWTQPTVALPQSIGNGPVFRGYGTSAANVLYTTDLIPVGLWGAWEVDWWLQATSVPASGVKLMVEGFTNIGDTVPVYSTTDSSSATSWTRKRLPNTGQPLVAFIKLSFWVAGATATSEVLIWDVRVRCPRDPN